MNESRPTDLDDLIHKMDMVDITLSETNSKLEDIEKVAERILSEVESFSNLLFWMFVIGAGLAIWLHYG